ncbi:MAG: NAD(+) synthase [Clostridia bacterium]|nr:NAD(+) synthase [Clostridia bacterium]
MAEKGEILAESELFANGLIYADIDYEYLQYVNGKNVEDKKENANLNIEFSLDKNSSLERCLDKYSFIQKGIDYKDIILMQAEGLKKRMIHTYSKKLVLGLSGGLDSTLAILVAVKVVDLLGKSRKDVIALTMPCFGTTSRTFENSVSLAKSLGVTLKKIDIGKSVKRHLKDISHPDGVFDSAYENAQARERTQILMDVANMENGMVVGTGDLSELALGFATYNGDHMSMYGVNAGIPKTLIRYIVKNYALDFKGKVKAVLLDILDTPISPELLPTSEKETKQKTEDIVGPYILHDYFLYNFLVRGYSPKKILALGEITFKGEFDKNTILKWLKIFFRRFFNQQFKRSCLPDGVKVGEISLSPRGAFTMPSDAVYSLWEAELNSL